MPDLPDRPAAREPRFSPFRRHRRARALSAYVLAELRDGRVLPEVLEDGWVRERTAEQPEILDDLAWDQEILAAIEDDPRAARPYSGPAERTSVRATPATC